MHGARVRPNPSCSLPLGSGALLGRPDPFGSCLIETSPRDAPAPNQVSAWVCAADGWCERASDLLRTMPIASANLCPHRPSPEGKSEAR